MRNVSQSSSENASGWLRSPNSRPFDFESIAFCARRQRSSILLLKGGNVRHRQLASKLADCSDVSPCNSEACRFCMRRFRWALLNQSLPQIGYGDWTAASIITNGAQTPLGSLNEFDSAKYILRWRKRIERSSILRDCRIVGGIDISLNRDGNSRVYWQPHLYILIGEQKSVELDRAVRDAFPAEPDAKRPYRLRTVKERLQAISYSYKSEFDLRCSYVNSDGESAVDDMPIPPSAQRELLLYLDGFSMGGRLLLRKFRRHGPRLNLLHLL